MAKYEYLKWCVEVANSDLTKVEAIQSLAGMAIKEGLFYPEEDEEIIKFLIQDRGLALKNNVRSLATAINSGKEFYINIKK